MSDVPVKEFRRSAHNAVDGVADYLDHTRNTPVRPLVKPGAMTAMLSHSGTQSSKPNCKLPSEVVSQLLRTQAIEVRQ